MLEVALVVLTVSEARSVRRVHEALSLLVVVELVVRVIEEVDPV